MAGKRTKRQVRRTRVFPRSTVQNERPCVYPVVMGLRASVDGPWRGDKEGCQLAECGGSMGKGWVNQLFKRIESMYRCRLSAPQRNRRPFDQALQTAAEWLAAFALHDCRSVVFKSLTWSDVEQAGAETEHVQPRIDQRFGVLVQRETLRQQ